MNIRACGRSARRPYKLWGIPLPMAVMPIIYFGTAAMLVRSWPLTAATVVFAVGHLAVSAHEWRKITSLAPLERMD